MAKLKCSKHKKRVVAVRGIFIHRTDFGSICDSPTAKIGGEEYTADEILQGEKLRKPEQHKKPWLQAKKDK